MKKIFILFAILVLTGCSAEYNLVITDKEEVKEKFYIYVDNQIIKNNSMSIDEYLDYYANLYSENDKYQDFQIKGKKGDSKSYFIVNRNYKNFDDYTSSYSFKSMFNSASIDRTGKYISFTTSENAYLKALKNNELLSEDAKYENFKISIKFYNEVVNSNSDEVDKKENIYSWNIKEDSKDNFIYFKIGPNKKYYVIFKDFVLSNLTLIITCGILLTLIIIIGLYMIIKSKKNNEI